MDTVSGSIGAGATTTAALPAIPSNSNHSPDFSMLSFATLTSWPSLATILVLYVVLCRSLRFRHERALLRRFSKYKDRASMSSMSNDEATEIMRPLIIYEFPTLYNSSLQFAIFKVSRDTKHDHSRNYH